MSALQPLDLMDFTGGANLRANVLQVADNESPSMLNVEIEPGQGFYTRAGWSRWNDDDIVAPASWDPRSGESHPLSDGSFQIYIAQDTGGGVGTVYAGSDPSVAFTDLSIPCNAPGHLADYASWGDVMYFVCGYNLASYKRDGASAAAPLLDASLGFNDDYTTPAGGYMPFAEHTATHAGYLFVSNTTEGGSGDDFQNRIRWSHPDSPEDWATNDYLDINIGGGKITGLVSFQDHLLIFKTDSLWALYGYDLDSWQLIQVSRAVGCPTPTAIARSESACYFFSASNRNAIFAYDGNTLREISDKVRPVMDDIAPSSYRDVWMGFVARRLWVSIPWSQDDPVRGNTIGVFDPDIADGVWAGHRLGVGTMRTILEGSDVDADLPLAVVAGDTGAACVVTLESDLDTANDYILENGDPTPFHAFYRTSWKHAGSPELRKSWLRTRFLAPRQTLDVEVRLDVFHDYNSGDVQRSLRGVQIESGGEIYWRELGFDATEGDGFDWTAGGEDDPSGRGANWTSAPDGADLGRTTTSLGVARSVQLEFSTSEPGKPWGFDGVFMKFKERRFTT